ncbi:MAG: prepilin peptidase [Porticoccaceae bacterium]|nr:prepilin peptidase [Porticoccaceae bacterium]
MSEVLSGYPLLALSFIFGLLVGSFLNVVVYRLPLQLQSAWRRESLDFLEMDPEVDAPNINLMFPNSRCPKCEAPIKPWQNIPVISYLFLKGRCHNCATLISIQYPLLELLCGLLTVAAIYTFGFTSAGLLAVLFTWILIALTGIDFNHHLLPDTMTLPLLWLGLIANVNGLFTDLPSAVIGAVAGYLTLWSVFWLFKLVTGKDGMGYGDFKLLAALGAWVGWQQLPLIILLSSLVGAIIGTLAIIIQGRDHQSPIPFGPYLAIAGWIALFKGEQITSSYLGLFH